MMSFKLTCKVSGILLMQLAVLLSIIHSALNRLMNSVKKHIIMIKVKSISMEKKHFITAECANRTQKVISEGKSVKSKQSRQSCKERNQLASFFLKIETRN